MEPDKSVKRAPKAAGCLVTTLDIPRICASLSNYGGQLGYGSCTVTLGFAIPFFADKFGVSLLTAGHLFVIAGIGTLTGVMLSARVLENDELLVSKTILSSFCVCAGGLNMFLASIVPSFVAVQVLVYLVFVGCGAADNFSTVALAEMWGQRVQPWMQSKTAAYAVGSMVPTIIIQSHTATYTAQFSALLCLVSVLGIIVEHVLVKFGWTDQPSTLPPQSSLSPLETDRPHSSLPPLPYRPHRSRRPSEAIESTGLLSGAPHTELGRYLSFTSEAAVPTMAAVRRMQTMERERSGWETTSGAVSGTISASSRSPVPSTVFPSAASDADADLEAEAEVGADVAEGAHSPLQSSLSRSFEAIRNRSRSISAANRDRSSTVGRSRSNTAMTAGRSRSNTATRHLPARGPDDDIMSSELVLLEHVLDSVALLQSEAQFHSHSHSHSYSHSYSQPKLMLGSTPGSAPRSAAGSPPPPLPLPLPPPRPGSTPLSRPESFNSSSSTTGLSDSKQHHQQHQVDTDIVRAVLDATEYCQVAEQDRENPFFEPSINRTLSFVPTKVVHRLEELEQELQEMHQQQQEQQRLLPISEGDTGEDQPPPPPPPQHAFTLAHIQLLPMSAKLCLAGMVFLQYGLASSMPGWTSMYITQNHIGSGTASTGAFVSSVYFCFLTMGAFLSIPLSVGFSTTTLLRMQLLLLSLGVCVIAISGVFGTLLLAPVHPARISDQASDVSEAEEEEAGGMGVFVSLCGGYAVMGYGMSVIVPLCLTMVNDYGLTMDPSSVSMAIMGGALGSSLVPPFMGYMISLSPAMGFILSVLGFGLALPLFYLQAHRVLLAQTAAAEATAAGEVKALGEKAEGGTVAPSVTIAATTDLDASTLGPSSPLNSTSCSPHVNLGGFIVGDSGGIVGTHKLPQNSYQKARDQARSLSLQQQVSEVDAEAMGGYGAAHSAGIGYHT